jgi:hypothetical protein
MSHAQLKHSDQPYLDPDGPDEPKTEPRIRVHLPLVPEPAGFVPRAQAKLHSARRAVSRLRFAPALFIGAALGSAPYLVQEHVRASTMDQPHIVETAPLAAAVTPPMAAPEPARALPPSPQPPPSALDLSDEVEDIASKPRHRRGGVERTLLQAARRQLKSGDAMGAQLALQRLAQRVPHGSSKKQRQLLEIQVLEAMGAKAEARRAASEFAKAYPRSRELQKLAPLLLGT